MRSPSHRRWLALAVLLVFACASAAGCGVGGASEPTSTVSPASTDQAADLDQASTEAPSSLTIAYPGPMYSLDPDLAVNTHEVDALHLIGGNLYEIQANGEVVPGLAERGSVSDDGLVWTFMLREGLEFSDGAPLSSRDVKATFERAINDERNAFAGLFAPIESVEAPDPLTVVIRVKRPYPSLPTILGYPAMMIMPEAGLASGKAFLDAPVSAGPYKLVSWGGGDNSAYQVNPKYWGSKPIVQTIEFVVIEDFNARFAQLKTGQIDLSIDFPPSLLPQLERTEGIEVNLVPQYGFITLDMWIEEPPLDDPNVRKAISLALDRDQINQVVWGGQLDMMAGFWPPTMEGYDPSISTARDVEKANELLADSACADGCTLSLEFTTAWSYSDQAAAIVSANLSEIGIDVELVKVDLGTWSEHHGMGSYELSFGGLADFANIPDGLLAYGFPKKGGGGLNANFSGWNSQEATTLVTRSVEATGDERSSALGEANRVFVDQQPYVTLGVFSLLVGQRYPTSVVSVGPSALIDIARHAVS